MYMLFENPANFIAGEERTAEAPMAQPFLLLFVLE